MFLHKAKQILRKFLLLRPFCLDNSKKWAASVFRKKQFNDKYVNSTPYAVFSFYTV